MIFRALRVFEGAATLRKTDFTCSPVEGKMGRLEEENPRKLGHRSASGQNFFGECLVAASVNL
jgi:hypothetical protein